MMWRYRYRRDYVGDRELVEFCNGLGEQGWSLVGAPEWLPGDQRERAAGVWRLFFKRTVTTREQVREIFALSPQEVQR